VTNYEQFNDLNAQYRSQGLEILAFPSNQFEQEPGANSEILNCLEYVRPGGGYQPTFNMFGKISVNGATRDPLYTWLVTTCGPTNNLLESNSVVITWNPVWVTDITWNFEKFLLDKHGIPYKRYNPQTPPSALTNDIAFLLSLP